MIIIMMIIIKIFVFIYLVSDSQGKAAKHTMIIWPIQITCKSCKYFAYLTHDKHLNGKNRRFVDPLCMAKHHPRV